MRKILLAAALIAVAWFVPVEPILAQGCGPSNPNCIVPTAPHGTSNNQAASTSFVQGALPVPGGSSGNVQYNNSGAFGGYSNVQLTALINTFSSTLSGAVPASGGSSTSLFLDQAGGFATPPTFSSGAVGYVPASGGGTANFLRADGTFDPVAASVFGRTGAVVATSGDYNAGQITYTAPGTGGTAITVAQHLQKELWSDEYGSVCNASTDDHVAFQNMINEAESLGSTANFTGNCALTTGLTISGSHGLIFQGNGFGQSQLTVLPSITAIAASNTGAVHLKRFYITEPTQTPCGATVETDIPAISATTMTGTFLVEDVETNCASPGITLAGTSDFHIHRVKVGNTPAATPIAIDIINSGATPSDDGDISNSLLGGYVHCTECAGLRFENNKINSGGTLPFGFFMAIPAGYSDGDLFFVGNSFEGISGNDIELTRASTTGGFGTVVVSGNELSGAIGVYIPTDATAPWISGIVVTGNLMAVSTAGTSIDSALTLTIANNTVLCATNAVVPNAIGSHVTRGVVGPNLAGTTAGAICASSTNGGTSVTTTAPF